MLELEGTKFLENFEALFLRRNKIKSVSGPQKQKSEENLYVKTNEQNLISDTRLPPVKHIGSQS